MNRHSGLLQVKKTDLIDNFNLFYANTRQILSFSASIVKILPEEPAFLLKNTSFLNQQFLSSHPTMKSRAASWLSL